MFSVALQLVAVVDLDVKTAKPPGTFHSVLNGLMEARYES